MRNFISNIIAGVIAAALFAFLQANSAAALDSINTALNPVLIASIIALVLLGICLGWLLRGLLVWRPKRRIQSEDANKHNREVIMQLDEANKRLLKALSIKGELFCRAEDWDSYCWAYGKDFLQQFIEYETIQGSRVRLKPKPNLKYFYEDNSDLFDVIDDQSIDERVVYDPEKQLSSGHYCTHELSWWWYTDDHNVKEEQDRIFEEQIKNSNWPITTHIDEQS